jgi:ketosteroid isomerase-like protein
MSSKITENSLTVLSSMFQAFNRHDAKAVLDLMTEDCVFDAAAGPDVLGARHEGPAAVRAAFEQVWATFPDVHWDDVKHFSCGDRAVSEWVFRATCKDGSRIEVQGCDLFTLRDGKIAVKSAFRKDRPVQKS